MILLNGLLIVVSADRRRKSITIKGKKSYLNQVEKSVKVILKEQTTPMKHAKQCRMNGDIAGYLAFLGSDESIRYPKYWQVVSKDGIADTTEHLTQLSDKDPLYQEVLKLFLDTFVDKRVGVGFDAKGLTHKKLVVKTISVVENKFLFQQYYSKKKQLCLQSSVNPIPPFASLKGEREIETRETCKSKGKLCFSVDVVIMICRINIAVTFFSNDDSVK